MGEYWFYFISMLFIFLFRTVFIFLTMSCIGRYVVVLTQFAGRQAEKIGRLSRRVDRDLEGID